MNFFRSLMASFTVAVFTAILLTVLGPHLSIGEEVGATQGIAASDLTVAFRYVFGAAAALLAAAALMIVLMEERPLAGPATAGAASAMAE